MDYDLNVDKNYANMGAEVELGCLSQKEGSR